MRRRPPGVSRVGSIELRDVSVRLGRHWALRDVSLEIRAGQRWLLTGPNGAGKTVLMKILRGDVWPTPTGRESRRYRVGREMHEQPLVARDRIAYLGPEAQDKFERYEWNLPVWRVVATGLHDSDLPLEQPTRRQSAAVTRALGDVGLAGLARRRFLSLSYGQRRRVLLARALVRRPDVLLLDEVLNGLDAASRRAFLVSLRRATTSRTCWVLSTHRRADVPVAVTHVARLGMGRLVEQGPREDTIAGRRVSARKTRGAVAGSPRTTASSPWRAASKGTRNPLVRLRGVSVFRDYRPVLQELDWQIDAGEHWAITGANGSGKSTFVALLYGDLSPAFGGSVERRGLAPGESIAAWKQRVGLVSPELQATYANGVATLLEVTVSGLHSSIGLNSSTTRAETSRARRALRLAGIDALRDRRVREVSYGQLRLALFARALVGRRELLLLDEPFDGLDDAARRRIRALLDAAVAGGTQVVVATHHHDDVPAFVTRTLDLSLATSRR